MIKKMLLTLGIIFVILGIIALIITSNIASIAIILGGLVFLVMSMQFKFWN